MTRIFWSLIFLVSTQLASAANPCLNPPLRGLHSVQKVLNQLLKPSVTSEASQASSSSSSQSDSSQLAHNWLTQILDQLKTAGPPETLEGDVDEIKLGSKPSTLVRLVHSSSYDGARKKDFLDRLEVMKNTALSNIPQSAESKELLDMTTENFSKKIKAINLNIENIKKEAEVSSTQSFDKAYKQALNYLKDYTEEVIKIVAKFPSENKNPSKAIRKELKSNEDEYVSGRGERNSLVTIYERDQNSPRMISVHRPFNEEGTVQNSGTRNKEGLPNALHTSFHVLKPDGSLETQFSATRHGVFTPYRIQSSWRVRLEKKLKGLFRKKPYPDEEKNSRLEIAKNNFKELLEQLVSDYKNSHRGQCPKRIPLSMTVLLSPTKLDFLRGHGESESEQLWETYLVSQAFSGREHFIGGCDKVIPEVSLMNLPSHTRSHTLRSKKVSGVLGKLGIRIGQDVRVQDSKLLNGINSKGFIEFDRSVSQYLDETIKHAKSHPGLGLKEILDTLEKFKDHSTSVNRFFFVNKEADRLKPSGELEKLQDKFLEQSLSDEELAKLTALEKEHQSRFQSVINRDLSELNLVPHYKNLHTLEGMVSKISENKDLPPDLVKRLVSQKELLRLYLESKGLFLPRGDHSLNSQNGIGIYNTNENRHKLQTRLILANYLLGKNVDFFCKSAEDRTGRIDNSVNESLIFRERHKRFPQLAKKEDQEELKTIALEALMGSSNQSTTGENNPGARGLQLHSDPAYGVYSKMGKKMGNLAKKVYQPRPLLERTRRNIYQAFANMGEKMRRLKNPTLTESDQTQKTPLLGRQDRSLEDYDENADLIIQPKDKASSPKKTLLLKSLPLEEENEGAEAAPLTYDSNEAGEEEYPPDSDAESEFIDLVSERLDRASEEVSN